MKANEVLWCLSARRQGSWQQFRSVVEELHYQVDDTDSAQASLEADAVYRELPVYQRVRLALERLAHVEFFAKGCEEGWRAAPPVIAVSRRKASWLGLLCGARLPALLDQIKDTCQSGVRFNTRAQIEGPDVVSFEAKDLEVLDGLAQGTGILLQRDAPLSLLSCIPRVDDIRMKRQGSLPFGKDWQVERFSISSLVWKKSSVEDATSSRRGLFRFSLGYRRELFLCHLGATYSVGSQVGKYNLLGRRSVLSYDRANRTLTVPAICRPPLLVERSLVLCSGELPTMGPDSTLLYTEVPETVARLASQLLLQELAK